MQGRLFRFAWPLTALLMAATLPWLPEQVGDPGRETGRVAYLASMLLSVAMAGLCSRGFVTWVGRHAPQQLNLPHKDYWLAPERREATLARLGGHVSVLGLQLLLLLAGIHVSLLLRSRPDWPQAPDAAWPLGAAALALWFVVWCWQVYRLFPAPPRVGPEPGRQPRRPDRPR
ncbi:MAG: hypothetical protein GXC94_17565 [Comamonadaceae bacterium]|jgi:hypothetical protein|nr:hypothetical protein [Comamonadaceae bacterium]